MGITSGSFLLFTLVALLVYYRLPGRAQNIWLLFLSYLFCLTWAWQFAGLLLLLTAATYLVGRKLQGAAAGRRRPLFYLGLGFNVAILLLFRSALFFVPQLEGWLAALEISVTPGLLQLIVPIGLSYYVLENISFLVDTYQKREMPDYDFVSFALYLAYFPKLIAGPIERPGPFLEQIARSAIVDNRQMARSVGLIVLGLVRKLLIADTLNYFLPWDLFTAPQLFGTPELWGWLVVYAFALYNDFAGYTSIARGVSGLFGIDLSPNFNHPYFSRSFGEFWQRWHITLSEWLRIYIFFPTYRALLRRFRRPGHPANVVVPPMATMLVSGLWHGLSGTMLIWGGLHGFYLIGERLLSLRRPAAGRQKGAIRGLLAVSLVFALTIVAWVPFAAADVPAALAFWGELFTWGGLNFYYRRLFLALVVVALALALDGVQLLTRDEIVFLRWPRFVQVPALAAFILLVLFLTQTAQTAEPFIYQGF